MMLRVVAAGALYFASVFFVAFAFGVVRTLVLEPALGETWAVACEAPLLALTMFAAAKWVVPRAKPPRGPLTLLGVGLIGLVFQQIAEVLLVRAAGETIASHLAYPGTTAGRIYLALLGLFLLMPLLVLRRAS
jgi:hypothetical protein